MERVSVCPVSTRQDAYRRNGEWTSNSMHLKHRRAEHIDGKKRRRNRVRVFVRDDSRADRDAQARMAKDSSRDRHAWVVHSDGGIHHRSKKQRPVYAMIICETDWITVPNTCHCCAERRLLGLLREQARREGVAPAKFSHWLHRKHGKFTVVRLRRDGEPGISLPCVICRKVLDRMCVRWKAHIGTEWVTDENAPASKPTQKQRALVF